MSDPGYPVHVLDPAALREVYVIHPPRRRYWLHLLLFLATVFTTLIVGARLEYNFARGAPQFSVDDDFFPIVWVLEQPSRLLMGIPFSAALLCILLAHEMGHFVYAQRHRVYATLPFFLPAPTIIGTFGAFIRIRSPIPNRNALLDIGIAGPIAGFIVAIPVIFLALLLSQPLDHASDLPLGLPIIFTCTWRILHLHGVPLAQVNLHPIGFAAWAGFLATALNLLPAGQLDGGHIIYSVAPTVHRLATRLTAIALFPMGIFLWGGWLFWGMVLLLPWMRHPPVPRFPEMNMKRKLVSVTALLMFALSLPVKPFDVPTPWDSIRPWVVNHFGHLHRVR